MSTSPVVLWQCPPKIVLVAVDFSDASARALSVAGILASAFDARLRALYAERFEPPPYFTLEQIARLKEERHAAQATAAGHLTRFAAGAASYPVESIVVDEPPVDAVLKAAASADLIVVGTHGRSGPGRWWLGSVAERVVRASTIPVLVTRPADTPPRDVLARLVLVQDGGDADGAARSCAGLLASIAGGSVVEGGAVTQCDTDVMQRSSLVVMTRRDGRAWSMADPVARALGGCQRPVLFIPAPGTHT